MYRSCSMMVAALAVLSCSAFAADIAVKAPPVPFVSSCVPGSCSGLYAGFGILGDGSNADIIGQGVNGSIFSAGGAIKAQGGYQLWNGNWIAGVELGAGYEFTTKASASLPVANERHGKFIGTELVKLGYNFFPGAGSNVTSPAQAPTLMTVPASILASSTPYLTFGGMQRRGVSQWVSGAGVDTVIASGWSSGVKYLYAPAQQGVDATHVVMIEVNRHF